MIRINAICPGYVETPLLAQAKEAGLMDGEIAKTPMKRMADVEEIADCIVFMASPMASFMTGSRYVPNSWLYATRDLSILAQMPLSLVFWELRS